MGDEKHTTYQSSEGKYRFKDNLMSSVVAVLHEVTKRERMSHTLSYRNNGREAHPIQPDFFLKMILGPNGDYGSVKYDPGQVGVGYVFTTGIEIMASAVDKTVATGIKAHILGTIREEKGSLVLHINEGNLWVVDPNVVCAVAEKKGWEQVPLEAQV